MKRKIILKISFLIIFLISSNKIFSQDAHYWSEQFGNKSTLLGGTVNAGVQDLGLVYYNPGRLAQIENPAFVISARVYELTNIQITNGLGEGKDLKQSNFKGGPSLVAGTFKIPFLKGHKFAYSFLTRYRGASDFVARTSTKEDELAQDIKYKDLSAKVRSNLSLNEEWYGLTWSYGLGEKLSVGITTFGFTSQNNKALELQMQGITEQNTVGLLNYNRKLNHTTYGLLWKAGIAAELKNINLGLTVTTPKINIAGSGSSIYENFVTGIDSLQGKPVNDTYIENFQKDLPARVRSPWAIGLGIAIKYPKTVIHISSEWFNNVDPFTVMEAQEFIGQQPMDTVNFRSIEALQAVLNFGLGIEHKFTDKINAYASIASDLSTVNSDASFLYEFDDDDIANSTFDGDIFHFGGGVSLNFKWMELTIGTTRGSSERTISRPLDLGDDELINPTADSKLKYRRWRFLVGFSFPFAAKITEEPEAD